MPFDINKIRNDFPILEREVNGRPLVYFDNAATSQKPMQVLDAVKFYYDAYNANIHRGVHQLSQEATDAYELARAKVQRHLNALNAHEIIFTSGTTFGINLVARGFEAFLSAGDAVVISHLEHHSNIVPWQMLCEKTGARLKVIPMTSEGVLDLSDLDEIISEEVRVVAVSHTSNALGVVNPIELIIARAKKVGAATLIDGAQAAPHTRVDVRALGCDFYVFSGHKMCAPTGTGILYGKEEWLEKLPPFLGGGEMIKEVRFEKTTYTDLPHKFEAGTPNISGGIGLGVALDYMNSIGFEEIASYEKELLVYATQQLKKFSDITIYGDVPNKAPVVSFNFEGLHPYDVGAIIDKMGVAVRTGHHCTQPIMNYLCIPGTIRASFAFYNTKEEIDRMIEALEKARTMLL